MPSGNGGKWITKDRRKRVYIRDDHTCVYCQDSIYDSDIVLTLDHIQAKELGGSNESANLVTGCLTCNSIKGAKTIRQFFVYLRDKKGIDTKGIAKRIRRQTNKSKNWRF